MLILASNSPRRQQILSILGINFKVIPSNFNENKIKFNCPYLLAEQLAILKGKEVSQKNQEPVLSADTVVAIDSLILGKPNSEMQCYEMLQLLSGRHHNVITGVSLTYKGNLVESFTQATKVYFKKLSCQEINWYIRTKDPYDKAGGYGIQGPAGIFVEKIEGCYYNVVGLPLSKTANLLKHHNLFKLED